MVPIIMNTEFKKALRQLYRQLVGNNASEKKITPLKKTPDITKKTFLFFGGLHRSGTSILHRLMRDNPDVSGFENTNVPEDEGQHLQTVFPPAKVFGGPGRFAFDSRSYLSEESRLISEESRDKLLREWGACYDLTKDVLLEKSPPNLVRSRFFQGLFPNSHFVFVVRHPIAVALATQKWSKTSIVELLLHWYLAHQKLLEDLNQLNRYHIFRYEDFIQSPGFYIQQISQAVGVDYFSPTEAVFDANQKYFDLFHENSQYQEDVSLTSERFPKCEKLMSDFGYSLSDGGVTLGKIDTLLLRHS